jgi:hypothetical protein
MFFILKIKQIKVNLDLEATKKIESVAGGGVPGRGATGTAQKANNNSAQLGNSIN